MTLPISRRLREAAAALGDERVTMQTLVQAHGPESLGSLLLLLAAPCLLPVPGVGTVLGLGLSTLALAMWKGQGEPRLPSPLADLALPRHWAQRVLTLLAATYALAGRHTRERLPPLASAGRRSFTSLAVGAMALLIVLPIPFGNILPALALMLLGLGLMFRDGVAVALGLLMSAVTLTGTLGLLLMAVAWGSDWVAHMA